MFSFSYILELQLSYVSILSFNKMFLPNLLLNYSPMFHVLSFPVTLFFLLGVTYLPVHYVKYAGILCRTELQILEPAFGNP